MSTPPNQTHPRPNPQNPDDVTRKEWSSLMKTYGQECHHVRREKKRKSAPPDNHRQKNAQPNDPRNDPKKKPRMEGRRRDGMDEQRKPPPKRGRESHKGSEEKPNGE